MIRSCAEPSGAHDGEGLAEHGAPDAIHAVRVPIRIGRLGGLVGERDGAGGGRREAVAGDADGGGSAVHEGGEEHVLQIRAVQRFPAVVVPRELEHPARPTRVLHR